MAPHVDTVEGRASTGPNRGQGTRELTDPDPRLLARNPRVFRKHHLRLRGQQLFAVHGVFLRPDLFCVAPVVCKRRESNPGFLLKLMLEGRLR